MGMRMGRRRRWGRRDLISKGVAEGQRSRGLIERHAAVEPDVEFLQSWEAMKGVEDGSTKLNANIPPWRAQLLIRDSGQKRRLGV